MKNKTPTTKHLTSNTKHQTPNTKHQTPNTKHQTPNTKHQTPNTKHHTPNTKHKTPNTQYQTPNTHTPRKKITEHQTTKPKPSKQAATRASGAGRGSAPVPRAIRASRAPRIRPPSCLARFRPPSRGRFRPPGDAESASPVLCPPRQCCAQGCAIGGR